MEMNEEEIIARNAPPPEQKIEARDIPNTISVGLQEDPGYTKLYNWFGIENEPSEKVKQQIKSIYDYAKRTTNGEWPNILWAVRSLETKLGSPHVGERRYTKMYGYVTLVGQRDILDKEIQSMEPLS